MVLVVIPVLPAEIVDSNPTGGMDIVSVLLVM